MQSVLDLGILLQCRMQMTNLWCWGHISEERLLPSPRKMKTATLFSHLKFFLHINTMLTFQNQRPRVWRKGEKVALWISLLPQIMMSWGNPSSSNVSLLLYQVPSQLSIRNFRAWPSWCAWLTNKLTWSEPIKNLWCVVVRMNMNNTWPNHPERLMLKQPGLL